MRTPALVVLMAALGCVQPTYAQSYRAVGTEGADRVAIVHRLRTSEGFMQAELLRVPRSSRSRGTRYSTLIADFDCEHQRRTLLIRVDYSSGRDPVQTNYDPGRTESATGNPSVARQLEAACHPDAASHRFSVEEFVRGDRGGA